MATNKWLGVAQPRIAVKAFQPSNVSPGSDWLLRVGGTNYQYSYPASIAGSDITDQERAQTVCDGLVEAYGGTGFGGGGTLNIESLTSELVAGKWSVVVRGSSDGAPIDVEISAAEATASAVKVVELQAGRAAQNEKQIIKWPKTPTGGNLSVRFREKAATVAYNASAATLKTALEGLSSIGSGNVDVTGSYTAGYTVEFKGALAGTDVELLAVTSTDSVGTVVVSYATTQRGGLKRTTYQMSSLDSDAENRLRFYYDGEASHYFTGAASVSQIQAAMESIPAINGNVDVNREEDGTYTIVFVAKLVGEESGDLSLESAEGSTVPTLTLSAGETQAVQAVQTVTLLNRPSIASGNITLKYNAVTAVDALSTATVSTINSAMTGAGLTAWQCTALQKQEGLPVVIEFTSVAMEDIGLLVVESDAVGCGAIEVRAVQKALDARNAIQQIALYSDPDGGTFTLTYGANTTSGIAYNASASTVQTAMEGLASIGSGNVSVDGNNGGPWIVTFQGSLAATAASLITGSGASLTIADSATITTVEIQSPTGPNWWTNARNWSLGTVPASSDTVVFQGGEVPCSYGISDVAAIAGLDVYRSYTGQIGLPGIRADGSTEQLPQYLSLSDVASKIAIRIGLGDEGDGPSLVRIDTQSQEADVSVLHSSRSPAGSLYTVGLAGDLASVQVNSASVIFSASAGLATTIDALRFLPSATNTSGDAVVEWGESCTVDYVEASGGALRCGSVPSAMVITGGSCSVRGSGSIDQISVRNATLRYLASGNLGLQGAITTLEADGDDHIVVTSVGHGLQSGDLLFISGIVGFADRYYTIEVTTSDKFVLLSSDATVVLGGSLAPSFFDDFFGGGDVPSGSSDGAKWGLADALRVGVGGTIDFSELGVARYTAAPVVLQSESAVIHDPLITISDLRWRCDPGFLDEHFGGQGVFKREQSVAVSYNSASYVNGGGGVVGG